MKSLILVAAVFSSMAFAAVRPVGLLSTEVVTCVNGADSLSIQVLSDVNGDPSLALATFVDYKRNGALVYSSSSFEKPYFVAAGAGGYAANGIGSNAGSVLSFGYDYMAYVARLEIYPAPGSAGRIRSVFALDNCKSTNAIGKFTNIGTPVAQPPVKKSPPKRKVPYKKI